MNKSTKDLIIEVYELASDFRHVQHAKEFDEKQKIITQRIVELSEILYYEVLEEDE